MNLVVKMWMILGAVGMVTLGVTLLAAINAWKSRGLFTFFAVMFGLVLVGVFTLALTLEVTWQKAQFTAGYIQHTVGVEVTPESLFYHGKVFDDVLKTRLLDIMKEGKETP